MERDVRGRVPRKTVRRHANYVMMVLWLAIELDFLPVYVVNWTDIKSAATT